MDQVQPILLVEDEALIRINLVDVLEEGGFTVRESINGEAAVADIDRSEALLGLVTDVRLGSAVDGWDVARHARSKFPAVAVVYITGDSAKAWRAQGVVDSVVLQKPFADVQLIEAVTTLLRKPGTPPKP